MIIGARPEVMRVQGFLSGIANGGDWVWLHYEGLTAPVWGNAMGSHENWARGCSRNPSERGWWLSQGDGPSGRCPKSRFVLNLEPWDLLLWGKESTGWPLLFLSPDMGKRADRNPHNS